MTEVSDLPIGELSGEKILSTLSIQERFERFHTLNPWVYRALERLTADYLSRGHRKVGIGMLWEVLRWHHSRLTSDPSSTYRLNDHYRSRYARLLVEQHPEWSDHFELRRLRAE